MNGIMTAAPRAILAEDEPLLATRLAGMLHEAWPELVVERIVHDGDAALRAIDALRPDVAFLDIRMPLRSGLEIAAELARRGPPVPAIVFVTAYDQYAIEAFEAAAADYLLKPVAEARLAHCVERLRARLSPAVQAQAGDEAGTPDRDVLASLRALLARLDAQPQVFRLRYLRASIGDVIRQIPVDEVLYFEACDKYVMAVTREASVPIRMPLSELLAGLDPERFAQIHRATIVRVDAIDTIRRDFSGRLKVHLREALAGRQPSLAVSRRFAARFRGM